MKKVIVLFTSPVILLLSLLLFDGNSTAETTAGEEATYTVAETAKVTGTEGETLKQRKAKETSKWYNASEHAAAAPLVSYALSLIGSPYIYGGKSPDGFDCSGFIFHVFGEFDVPVTRSSTTQAHDGVPVDKAEAQPGDLVIFTGTDKSVREPGHVGIVISEPGDTISFVHSSSNGGVKISQVEGTGYDDRFLEIRRVL